MSLESWKAIFEYGGVILLFLTFVFGAGVVITTNRINELQAKELREFNQNLVSAQTELSKQKTRAADADARVASLEIDASDARAAQQRVEIELSKQQERTARAEKELLELQERTKPRHLTLTSQKAIAAKLKLYAGQKINLVTYGGDSEITMFATEVVAFLSAPDGALWRVTQITGGAPTGSEGGIVIEVEPNASKSVREIAGVLASALRTERLEVIGPEVGSNIHRYIGATITGGLTVGDTSVITMTIAKKP